MSSDILSPDFKSDSKFASQRCLCSNDSLSFKVIRPETSSSSITLTFGGLLGLGESDSFMQKLVVPGRAGEDESSKNSLVLFSGDGATLAFELMLYPNKVFGGVTGSMLCPNSVCVFGGSSDVILCPNSVYAVLGVESVLMFCPNSVSGFSGSDETLCPNSVFT